MLLAGPDERIERRDQPRDRPRDPSDVERLSDDELVALLESESPAALRELYQRHSSKVFAAAARVLHDGELAGDVTQDVFVRLWRQPSRFDASRAPLGAFLCLQARRMAIDARRENGSRHRRELHAARTTPTDSDESGPWASAWHGQVRAAVRTLDVTQRRPIELAFFDGLSYREVAQVLGEPEGTTKSRIRAGLHKLRAVLATPDVGDWAPPGPLSLAVPSP